MSKKQSKQSLEGQLQILEQIVEILEQGQITLDDALTLFEEGIQLSKECNEKLQQAELRIKKLTKTLDGSFKVSEFEAEEEE